MLNNAEALIRLEFIIITICLLEWDSRDKNVSLWWPKRESENLV